MDRAALVRRFRHDTDDVNEPHKWSDEWVYDALDDAQAEACLRGRLLYAAGQADLCQIAVTAGTAVYPLHPAIYELVDVRWVAVTGERAEPLEQVSVEVMDSLCRDWRARTGQPRWLVQDDTKIRLVPAPSIDGTLALEGYRLPLVLMATGDNSTSPEVHQAHHRYLVEWVKYMAYSIPDTDKLDLERAGQALDQFTKYFGLLPNSDLRRSTRHDVVHANEVYV